MYSTCRCSNVWFYSFSRDLSDFDKDGRLNVEEFCIALFLIDKAAKGIPPPTTLPPELQPKKVSQQGVAPLVTGQSSPSLVSNLEDKKKENFEKGKAELERRRRAIQEREQKEKVNGLDIGYTV